MWTLSKHDETLWGLLCVVVLIFHLFGWMPFEDAILLVGVIIATTLLSINSQLRELEDS